MLRINFSFVSCSAFVFLGALSGCTTRTDESRDKHREDQKPNILFLFADDQRADALGCSGNTYIKTPNIDRIAQSGIRFTNAYIMGGHHGAISAPSRAMLLSGRYLFNVYDRLDGVTTMPMHFAANGYETFGTGKWHNEQRAFENSFQKGKSVFLGGMSDHFSVPCRDLGPDGKLSEPEFRGFSTDVFSDAAIGFINEYASGERKRPFFCYVAFTAPHDPYSPRPDYIGKYPDQAIPLPGNFIPLHPFQFDDLTIRDENLAPWPRTPDVVRSALADYYGLISHLDNRIGDILDALYKNGLIKNTIIVYAADNGLAIGSHGLLGKQNLYEHSMKVPLIISGAGIPQGKVSQAFVYLLDVYPTLCELAGLPEPEKIDGLSFAPVINRDSAGPRRSVMTAYRHTARAVRENEWKLIRYPERDFFQLFNLNDDPLELNNLAYRPDFFSKRDELFNLLKMWQKISGDTVPLSVSIPLPLNYDYTKLVRKPDINQPQYTLKKYFNQ
jgi:arylsulfatase A-like enzyme